MTSQPLGGEGWTDLFRRRNTWQLTNDTVRQWIENNTDLFHFLSEFVPPNGHVIDLGCGPGRHSLRFFAVSSGFVAPRARRGVDR
jgi:hypothetical protein